MSHRSMDLWPYARQRGATTLLITVLILFLASLLVIAVSRTSVVEQRLSANEIRSRQAFEAAQAGYDHALAALQEAETSSGLVLTHRCLRADNDCSNALEKPFAEYRVAYCNPTNPGPVVCPDVPGAPSCNQVITDPAYAKKPLIVSCGWSDDRLGRRIIRQGFDTVPALGNPSTVPFIGKGSINVEGSATFSNFYTNLNIWSGGALTDIGNSGKTYVRDPNIAPPSKLDPPPAPPPTGPDCGAYPCYIKVTDKTTTGPDVIDTDPTLSNLTDEQMFKYFTGADDVDNYRDNVATRSLTAAEAEANPSPLDGLRYEAVVVDGDFTLPNSDDIGSREEPVVLIVDGNLTGGGSPVVHGIVYVTGNLTVAGNITVYGGMVVEGNTGGTGSLDIVYDPFVIENADENAGRSAPKTGDWRDW